jgi:hypothetical protein
LQQQAAQLPGTQLPRITPYRRITELQAKRSGVAAERAALKAPFPLLGIHCFGSRIKAANALAEAMACHLNPEDGRAAAICDCHQRRSIFQEITCMELSGPSSTTAIATRHQTNRKQAGP